MKELTEIRFNDNRVVLKENLVKGPILPRISSELERDVEIQGDCVVDGAIYARTLEIQQGDLEVRGAVFTQSECHVNADAKGRIMFRKAVGSAGSIVSLGNGARTYFLGDLSARQITLRNAYVSASLYGDDIRLEECVVVGGVFGARSVELTNCLVGTFNSPSVRLAKSNYLLFPSAFSVEQLNALPGTTLCNLTLADLGAHMRGVPPAENTGKIAIDVTQDEIKSVLTGEGVQQILRSYSVVGKVLAVDLADYDKLKNHFLLSCASLGGQLLQTYDLGGDSEGSAVSLTPENLAAFFFDILAGKIEIPDLSGDIDIAKLVRGESLDFVSDLDSAPVPPAEAAVDATADAVAVLCRHCGEPLETGSVFCDSCGKPQN